MHRVAHNLTCTSLDVFGVLPPNCVQIRHTI